MSNRLFSVDEDVRKNSSYTQKTQIPQYCPSDKKPSVKSLVDTTKYSKLLREIEKSDISEDEKLFLKLAASRHLVFDYSRIADYYANSNEDIQRLMEKSALVIIDIDDAIANGYVRLSKEIERIMSESGKSVRE